MSNFYGVDPTELPSDERFTVQQATTSLANQHISLGAEAMHAMFGLDKSMVTDTLQADYETLPTIGATDLATVGLNLVNAGETGITPAQLVAGYNKVAGSKDITEMYLWPDMYAHRSADWFNKRTPIGESAMTKAPLFGAIILGATTAPEGTSKNWEQQQKLLQKALSYTTSRATEGVTPSDIIVADAMALIASDPTERTRIDSQTFARFVQHDRDVRSGVGVYGPSADVDGGRLNLDGDSGDARGNIGFRRLVGPKA